MKSCSWILALLATIVAHTTLAGTVIWDVFSAGTTMLRHDEYGREYYEVSFGCSTDGDGVRAFAWVVSTFVFSGRNVVVSPWAMDVGSGKFIVKAEQGDLIDAESVRDEDRLFDNNWGIGYGWDAETGEAYDNRHDIVVPRNGSFMLGFEIDNESAYDPVAGEFDKLYGWAIFQFDGTSVSVTSSALAVGTDGIYAGTGIIIPRQIPEPGTLSLVIFGIVVLSMRRRM